MSLKVITITSFYGRNCHKKLTRVSRKASGVHAKLRTQYIEAKKNVHLYKAIKLCINLGKQICCKNKNIFNHKRMSISDKTKANYIDSGTYDR